jgi:hypothetical protein
MKFTPVWIEAFIIFSAVWTFGSILNETGKKDLDQRMKESINKCKSDFVTYQKEKKRQ